LTLRIKTERPATDYGAEFCSESILEQNKTKALQSILENVMESDASNARCLISSPHFSVFPAVLKEIQAIILSPLLKKHIAPDLLI
jgi:hypothetical protein